MTAREPEIGTTAPRARWFFGISIAYCVLLVGAGGMLTQIPYLASEPLGHAARGCHLTGDQLVFGASCHEFWGAHAAEVVLSLPLALVLLPLSGLGLMDAGDLGTFDMAGARRLLLGAIAVVFGVSLWTPVVYFIGTVRRLTQFSSQR